MEKEKDRRTFNPRIKLKIAPVNVVEIPGTLMEAQRLRQKREKEITRAWDQLEDCVNYIEQNECLELPSQHRDNTDLTPKERAQTKIMTRQAKGGEVGRGGFTLSKEDVEVASGRKQEGGGETYWTQWKRGEVA